MSRDRTLTGAQKAAVFILHMGKDRSAEILRSMRETEVAEIMAEVARMRTVNSTVVEEVIGDVPQARDDIVELARRYARDTEASIARFRSQERISFRLRIVAVHDHLED